MNLREPQYYFQRQLFAPKVTDRQRRTTVDRDRTRLIQTYEHKTYNTIRVLSTFLYRFFHFISFFPDKRDVQKELSPESLCSDEHRRF